MKIEKQKMQSKMIIERLIKHPRLVWDFKYVMQSDQKIKGSVK